MKLAFLGLDDDERRLYFAEAAARRGVSAVIIEKDFWVCWLLAILDPYAAIALPQSRPRERSRRYAAA